MPPANRPQHADSNFACIACGAGMDVVGDVPDTTVCANCWNELSTAEKLTIFAQFDQSSAIKNHARSLSAFGDKITAAQQAISAAAKEIRTASQEVANLFEEAREDYLKLRQAEQAERDGSADYEGGDDGG